MTVTAVNMIQFVFTVNFYLFCFYFGFYSSNMYDIIKAQLVGILLRNRHMPGFEQKSKN